MRSKVCCLLLFGISTIASSQVTRPDGWRVRADGGAPDSVRYDRMPPGWHITSGPASIVYSAENRAQGRFAVETEIHLFPGESNEGFGLFIGGTALDANESWTAFLITRDGSAAIEKRVNGATTVVYPPAKAAFIKPHTGEGTAFNSIRVLVQGDSATFSANGQRITAVHVRELPVDGVFGFRVGNKLNLHVTNLDLITRLAPFPVRR